MNITWEHQYLLLLKNILANGEDRHDRTGVGTRALFGETMSIDLSAGFPLLTTKKMGLKTILSELLWFIEGSGDERRLAEILHGTRDPSKQTIWTANAKGTTGAMYQPKFPGDLGRVYGVQWRDWRTYEFDSIDASEPGGVLTSLYTLGKSVDQLAELIHRIKTKPTDRRLILSAWNPGELNEMALPPCHMMAQFYVSNDKKLSCQMYMRSIDTFLGLPFNVASYALLTHAIAQVCGLGVGKLVMVLGDTHIYSNHHEVVQEQLSRQPFAAPKLTVNPAATDINSFMMTDFFLEGYQSHGPLKAEMAA